MLHEHCNSYYSIAVKRCHDEGNFKKKTFRWGLAYSFRGWVYIVMVRCMAADRQTWHWSSSWSLTPSWQVIGRARETGSDLGFWNLEAHPQWTYLLQWGHISKSFLNCPLTGNVHFRYIGSILIQTTTTHSIVLLSHSKERIRPCQQGQWGWRTAYKTKEGRHKEKHCLPLLM